MKKLNYLALLMCTIPFFVLGPGDVPEQDPQDHRVDLELRDIQFQQELERIYRDPGFQLMLADPNFQEFVQQALPLIQSFRQGAENILSSPQYTEPRGIVRDIDAIIALCSTAPIPQGTQIAGYDVHQMFTYSQNFLKTLRDDILAARDKLGQMRSFATCLVNMTQGAGTNPFPESFVQLFHSYCQKLDRMIEDAVSRNQSCRLVPAPMAPMSPRGLECVQRRIRSSLCEQQQKASRIWQTIVKPREGRFLSLKLGLTVKLSEYTECLRVVLRNKQDISTFFPGHGVRIIRIFSETINSLDGIDERNISGEDMQQAVRKTVDSARAKMTDLLEQVPLPSENPEDMEVIKILITNFFPLEMPK